MAEHYKPEVGQMLFGQPYKRFAVPNIWEAALIMLRDEIGRAMRNIHQEKYDSPFDNSGTKFVDCLEFTVDAYSWNENVRQPFNFKWHDVEISWYKYLSRGMSANQELSPQRASIMLDECLRAIGRYEAIQMRAKGFDFWPEPESGAL